MHLSLHRRSQRISEQSDTTFSSSLFILETPYYTVLSIFIINLLLTGIINAKNVIEKAPEKLRKRPNLGTKIENNPVINTTKLLKM